MIEQPTLAQLGDAIYERLRGDEAPDAVIASLVRDHGARHRFANGTYELRLAGVTATCTAGGFNLLSAWSRKARLVGRGGPQ